MAKTINIVFIVIFSLFLTACGGGGSGVVNDNETIINGKVVDNYIAGATVCIDADFNNICDPSEISTKTNDKGEFTLKSSADLNDSVVVIAYDGNDTNTNEPFKFIVKNIATNKDSNNQLILSSLNTLVADYVFITNTTLENSKNKIASFIDSNDTAKLVTDLIANKNTNPDEFVKSLTIFQMIDKINTSIYGVSNYHNSAVSFKALATSISNNTLLRYDDTNISVSINNTVVNATITNMKPVFISSITSLVEENQANVIDVDAVDDNATLIYSIDDTTNFHINSSTGVVTFKTNKLPNYEDTARPTHQYTFVVTVSDQTNDVNQTITINIKNVNEAPVLGNSLSFNVYEDNDYNGTLPNATDVDSSNLIYSLESNSTHGIVSLNLNGTFSYMPNGNYYGTDSFSYKVYDGSLYSTTQTVNISVISVNDTPVFTSSSAIFVDENQLGAIDINAIDVDNDSLSYSISGTDASYFDINSSTGVATFNVAPNYEDSNNVDHSYTFTATVSDGNAIMEQNITINIKNLNDNQPLFTSVNNATVDENQLNAIDINATDGDGDNTLAYGIKDGLDKSFFNINSLTGAVAFKNAPDYESKTSYTFVATVSDGITTQEQSISINIHNINEFAPVFISGTTSTVNENQLNAIDINASDEDGDALTYYISGTDENNFTINSLTGVVTFKNAPDYETKTSYTFTATVSDGENNATQTVTIAIQNNNDNSPVIFGGGSIEVTVNENQLNAIDINATDLDLGALIYTIGGDDASYFDINSSTGVITFKTVPNYEDLNNVDHKYTFTATVNDGTHNVDQNIIININNLNDNAPIFTSSSSPSVDENQTQAMIVSATDADNLNSLTYGITSDGNATLFDINSSTGVVTFKNAALDNDYEKAHFYTFKVTASDGNFTSTQDINLSINSINLNAPRFTSDNNVTVNENQQSILTLVATDADTNTALLVYGVSDTTNFDINSSTGVLTFKTDKLPDYETTKFYTFTASVTDGTYPIYQNVTINVNNLNDNAPRFAQDNNISVAENQINVIDDLHVTDADGNLTVLTYSLSEDNATLFDINTTTGVITFKDINSSDYEKVHFYKFKVRVSDGSFTTDQNITVTLNNLNDNLPIFTSSNNVSIDENQTFAIDINATDSDNNNLIFSLVGSLNDANSFDINDSTGVVTFKSNQLPDYESGKISYSFTARVSDGLNNIDQNVTLSINNLNDNMPIFHSPVNYRIIEGIISSIELNATDNDIGSVVTYGIGGTDVSFFDIVNSTVTFKSAPIYDNKHVYNLIAIASDGEHNVTSYITININSLNKDTNLTGNTVIENNELNISVGTFSSAFHDNLNPIFTYDLVAGYGDNSLFSIIGDQLKINTITNYEAKSSYEIKVIVVDNVSSTFEKAFVIYISDTNEAPAITTLNYGSFDQSTNLVTPSLAVSDPDAGDTHAFAFNPNPNLGSLDINSTTGALSGLVGDVGVGFHIIKVKVTDGGDLNSTQDITLTINEVNDKPNATHYKLGTGAETTLNNEVNLTIEASTKTTPISFVVSGIDDGDIHLVQNVTLTGVNNSNPERITVNTTDADGTDGSAAMTFSFKQTGRTTLSFELEDNGTPSEKRTFILNLEARPTGWDIYNEQKISNYINNSVDFDGITYTWNNTNRWYENNTLGTILMPMKSGVGTNNQGQNVHKQAGFEGHYYVNKHEYMHALRVGDGNLHTANNYYESADGNISGIRAVDRNFQHDKNHHAFVSTIIYGNDNFISFNYNNGWIKEASSIHLNANDTNRTFGTDINLSIGYSSTSQQIDSNNDGNDTCADYYGLGWRLPTAYEMGININSNQANSYKFGYIPSYVGDSPSPLRIISSTVGIGSSGWVLGNGTGESAGDLFSKDDQYARCIYVP